MDSSIRSIEKMLRESLKLKLKVDEHSITRDNAVVAESGHGDDGGGTEWHWARGVKAKVADLPMFEGEGVDDWVFRAWQYLETFAMPIEQRIRVLSFHLVGAAYAWYRWGINNNITYN
ncbi:hypothetical protein AAHE18_09G095800 [Arachis hypogaea]